MEFSYLGAELSEQTLNALQEFYLEKAEKEATICHHHSAIDEDWELSQFWYDEKTARILCQVALTMAGDDGRIVCVSSPTVFAALWEENLRNGFLLEYDKRFQKLYGENFIFYDYNKPLDIPQMMEHAFDVVVVDPPFLSRECLEKTSQTVEFLSKQYIIFCTGAAMEETVYELLGLRSCVFQPCHKKKLGNEFKCYANFDFDKHIVD